MPGMRSRLRRREQPEANRASAANRKDISPFERRFDRIQTIALRVNQAKFARYAYKCEYSLVFSIGNPATHRLSRCRDSPEENGRLYRNGREYRRKRA